MIIYLPEKKSTLVNACFHGDCLELLKTFPDKSFDMILCDLPYGTTQNKWDSLIPLNDMWGQYVRIMKPNAAICLTAQIPFSVVLANSRLDLLRYEWIWKKSNKTGFLNANKMPLKEHENILVFYKTLPKYNPQFSEGKPYTQQRGSGSSSYNYNEFDGGEITVNNGYRYPTSIIGFKNDKKSFHPTQKPVALFEYLIKTYTDEGDLILDNCAGSGTTGVAAINTGRNFTLIEKDKTYFDLMVKRLKEL